MELLDAIRERKSIRAFTSVPVDREEIEKIVSAGIAAPSKGNCQIWEFVAVTGDRKKALDAMLLRLLKTDLIPSMTVSDASDSPDCEALVKAKRRSGQNKEELSKILQPLGLSFDDFMLEGTFTFFSAPVALLVFVDGVFAKDLAHVLSVGACLQNMLLAATDLGLGACWIGGVWRYEKQIRGLLEIPDGKRLLSSMALGHAATDSPIYGYKAGRDPITEFVRMIGFNA